MQKSVLGKNLGTLLGRGSVEGPPVASLPPRTQTLTPGVRSLMRGQPVESPFAEPAAVPQTQPVAVPRWYLFAGDIVLVSLALIVCYRSPKLTWKQEIFAILVVALGGVLGAMAVGFKPFASTEQPFAETPKEP